MGCREQGLQTPGRGKKGGEFMTLFEMALLALATAWGAGLALCYRLGLRDGLRAARGEAPRLMPGGAAEAGPTPPEQQRYDAILANIDAYDGTAEGQRDV